MNYFPDDVEHVNRDLARRNERLAAAMRELETLAFPVSHDFKVPLNAIERAARAILERTVDAETAQGLLVIRDNIAVMQAMIRNLREHCGLASQPLELESIDMEALAREAWAGIENRERVAFSLGKLPAVRGHRDMLKLVWTNLLSNAVGRSALQEWPRVEVTGEGGAEFAVYSVSDNGPGLDLDYVGKLLCVLERIQELAVPPGTGVGLAIVQRIVTRHRGNVWVEAHRQKGALFQFALPIAR
jgi:light-regulated signal transduction histidine kinase (bacteriophytochrome)